VRPIQSVTVVVVFSGPGLLETVTIRPLASSICSSQGPPQAKDWVLPLGSTRCSSLPVVPEKNLFSWFLRVSR
jgi:hypothetical protein